MGLSHIYCVSCEGYWNQAIDFGFVIEDTLVQKLGYKLSE